MALVNVNFILTCSLQVISIIFAFVLWTRDLYDYVEQKYIEILYANFRCVCMCADVSTRVCVRVLCERDLISGRDVS